MFQSSLIHSQRLFFFGTHIINNLEERKRTKSSTGSSLCSCWFNSSYGKCKVVPKKVEWRRLTHRGVFDELGAFRGCIQSVRTCLRPAVSVRSCSCVWTRPWGRILKNASYKQWVKCLLDYKLWGAFPSLSPVRSSCDHRVQTPTPAVSLTDTALYLLSSCEKHVLQITGLCLTSVCPSDLVSGVLWEKTCCVQGCWIK